MISSSDCDVLMNKELLFANEFLQKMFFAENIWIISMNEKTCH